MVTPEVEKIIKDVVQIMYSLDFSRDVKGALKSCIDSHGPVSLKFVGSANKRIVHGTKGTKLTAINKIYKKYGIKTEEEEA